MISKINYCLSTIWKLPNFICDNKITKIALSAMNSIFSVATAPFRWTASILCEPRDHEADFKILIECDVSNSGNYAIAQLLKNQYKNRYCDVLPNEPTRVKISDEPKFYFNANWVLDGSVIASQGPLQHEHDDFWKMILAHDIKTVVMLTDLRERGFEKCTNYWKPDFFSNSQASLMKEEVIYTNGKEQIVKREIEIGPKKKIVTQYHLQNFPDHGIVKPETLAFLVKETAKREGKILAHCSAGIGRTGTYCAALEAYRTHSIDLFSIVQKLRHPKTGRSGMVQTSAQYVLANETANLIAISLPSRVWSAVWQNNRA